MRFLVIALAATLSGSPAAAGYSAKNKDDKEYGEEDCKKEKEAEKLNICTQFRTNSRCRRRPGAVSKASSQRRRFAVCYYNFATHEG